MKNALQALFMFSQTECFAERPEFHHTLRHFAAFEVGTHTRMHAHCLHTHARTRMQTHCLHTHAASTRIIYTHTHAHALSTHACTHTHYLNTRARKHLVYTRSRYAHALSTHTRKLLFLVQCETFATEKTNTLYYDFFFVLHCKICGITKLQATLWSMP